MIMWGLYLQNLFQLQMGVLKMGDPQVTMGFNTKKVNVFFFGACTPF
jgi:hypothetical protein